MFHLGPTPTSERYSDFEHRTSKSEFGLQCSMFSPPPPPPPPSPATLCVICFFFFVFCFSFFSFSFFPRTQTSMFNVLPPTSPGPGAHCLFCVFVVVFPFSSCCCFSHAKLQVFAVWCVVDGRKSRSRRVGPRSSGVASSFMAQRTPRYFEAQPLRGFRRRSSSLFRKRTE